MKHIILKRLLVLPLLISLIFTSVACSQTIAYGLNSQIWVLNVNKEQKFMLINPPSVLRERGDRYATSWSSDGKTIAAVIDGSIWLADIPSRKSRLLISSKHKPFLGTTAWSKDGTYLYVGRYNNDENFGDGGLWQIKVNNRNSHLMIQPKDVDLPIHADPLVSEDGHYLISSGMITGEAFFYAIDLRSNKPIQLPNIQIFKSVACYTFDKSCKILLLGGYAGDGEIGNGPGGVWRWALTTNKCTPWILQGQSIDNISISPNGKIIIICINKIEKGTDTHIAYLFSISGQKLTKLNISGDINYITWLDNVTFLAENAPAGDHKQTNIIRYNIRTGDSHIIVKGGYGVSVAFLHSH